MWSLAKRANAETLECWPGLPLIHKEYNEGMSKILGHPVAVSLRTVATRLKELKDAKVITAERRAGRVLHTGSYHAGTWASNVYTINPGFVIHDGQTATYESVAQAVAQATACATAQAVASAVAHRTKELTQELTSVLNLKREGGSYSMVENTDEVIYESDSADWAENDPPAARSRSRRERVSPAARRSPSARESFGPTPSGQAHILAQEFVDKADQLYEVAVPTDLYRLAKKVESWLAPGPRSATKEEVSAAIDLFCTDRRIYQVKISKARVETWLMFTWSFGDLLNTLRLGQQKQAQSTTTPPTSAEEVRKQWL